MKVKVRQLGLAKVVFVRTTLNGGVTGPRKIEVKEG
jgi:hypothetical protein